MQGDRNTAIGTLSASVRPAPANPLLPRLAWPLTGADELAAAVARVRDWPALLELARRQNLLGLVARRLAEARPAAVPDSVAAEVTRLRQLLNRTSLVACGQLLRIVELFEGAGIAALPFKGPALSQDLYGDPALRTFCDLDFVVRPEDAAEARRLLLAGGFEDALPYNERILRRGARSESEVCLVGKKGDPFVDLHWRLTVGFSAKAVTAERLLRGSRDLPFLGHTVPAPSVHDQLLIAALHAARHDWTPLELRLAVALQVTRLPEGDWPELCATARELGCLRRLLVGVAHACRPFGVPVPAEVLRLLRADPFAPGYAAYLQRAAGRHEQDAAGREAQRPARPEDRAAGPAVAGRHLPALLWRAAAEDQVAESLGHLVARAVTPGPEDWAARDLPDGLDALYWVLRPARLARKYAGAAG